MIRFRGKPEDIIHVLIPAGKSCNRQDGGDCQGRQRSRQCPPLPDCVSAAVELRKHIPNMPKALFGPETRDSGKMVARARELRT